MTDKKKICLMLVATIILICLYLLTNLRMDSIDYLIPKRILKILAILIVGYGISYSSVIFQTLTCNRIVTPSIIGFDSLYLLIQGIVVYFLGVLQPSFIDPNLYFILTVLVMVVFSEVLYKILFQSGVHHLYFILLAGVVCGILFRSVFSFLITIMDPMRYDIIQGKLYASFSLIQYDLLGITFICILFATWYSRNLMNQLDVYLLGESNAKSLGIDTGSLQKKTMRAISIMIASSTVLVGPITFLGLFVVNIAYSFIKNYKHTYTIAGSVVIGWIILLVGTIFVDRIFEFETNLTVVINGIGGVYFIYMLIKRGTRV